MVNYSKLPNLVLAFHGCGKEAFENVIYKQEHIIMSNNPYDWLGHGMYFWENNCERAYLWAKSHFGNDAKVIGAVIDLGNCLNLTDSSSEEVLSNGYKVLKAKLDKLHMGMPNNRYRNENKDVLLRDLDCSVITQVHEIYSIENGKSAFDSVRGVFIEGKPPYPGAAMRNKTHIQICVRNPNCIKGYFVPREKDNNYPIP